ncbi:putative sulfate exporter family transporter [Endozoicomonas gorgoniicola]|uniref:Sulfate exporter family transporter n=1 Tax=Endozoicomonas gorgoniicola TaxID=1234144 RepID=A0ABT3MP73_9GAMM|nr:putative sulfate exporter family transporter [Endozoicomonas gorgoniicola]MCW7551172.1 putative sulfate exporter family transporter [Endozoicomonas gorgoniicola]
MDNQVVNSLARKNPTLPKQLPGLLLACAIAAGATVLAKMPFNSHLHISGLLYAIILGMVVTNVFWKPEKQAVVAPGITYASKDILRLGVIMLGFKLSLSDIMILGWQGLVFIILLACCTFGFCLFICSKMKLAKSTTLCIAAGTTVCGASAIAAVAPIIKASGKDTAFGIGAITLFGTVAMFILPAAFHHFQIDEMVYAVWTGASLPEVAEVVAAGAAVGSSQVETFAILTKLCRVLFLIPLSIGLCWYVARSDAQTSGEATTVKLKDVVPMYVVLFLAVIIVNSTGILTPAITAQLKNAGAVILAIALAALGLKTRFSEMMQVGLRPIIAAFICALFIQVFAITGALVVFG